MRQLAALCFVLILTACQAAPEHQSSFAWRDASVTELQQAMATGHLSAEPLTQYYLSRIETHNRQGAQLRAVNNLNPNALTQARKLDEERQKGHLRGPLHGIPVLLKDNIDTANGAPNTAGSLLFSDNYPQEDAFLVTQLRLAGAVILGKANLSEWANFRSTRSSSGWSAVGGQAVNPYDPTRSTCGSSAGSATAVAADFVTLAVGTETNGSLVCPAAVNGIVTIKPTLGLISRDGIIPIAHSQDTPGPMARSVADATLMLDAMVAYDSSDPAGLDTQESFSSHLNSSGLEGKRIGVVRNLMGYNDLLDRQFGTQLKVLKAAGATLVDVTLPHLGDYGTDEFTVLLYEFRHDIAAYLQQSQLPYNTLSDLIAANEELSVQEMPLFGQELFEMANDQTDETAYQQALKNSKRLAGTEGIDALLKQHQLDLLIAPTTTPAWKIDHINGDHYSGSASSPAAVAGYPHISVPMGYVQVGEEPALPVGLSFFGTARSEATLIEAAFAYEQATQHRRAPNLVAID